MTENVTVAGTVATEVKHTVTAEGLEISSFRLASNHRRFDRTEQKWVDAETNWFSVTAFRQFAANVHSSIEKGQRVLVTGRLRVREWTSGEKTGHDVEIVAESLGHDVAWGTSRYTRTPRTAAQGADQSASDSPDSFPVEAQVEPALPF
jgi:single-strand DNA-binding protein